MPENKHIIDIISDCIATLRTTSNILNIVDNNNNTFTFNVDNLFNLKVNDWIKIINCGNFNTSNEKIISVNSINKSFTINKTTGTVITTFGTITTNSPYYDFGYWLEESNRLTIKGQSNTYKNQKFPLIFLQLGINEQRNNLIQASKVNNLNIYILTETKQDSFSDWRLENTFKPILIPLYKNFIETLALSSYIFEYDISQINHNYEEKHSLGNLEANETKVNQWVDAIHLQIDLTYKIFGDCN